jgi:predicted kinase
VATIYLIEGPVGSGKSTLAANLHKELNAPRLILDRWMTNLFSPDRPAADFVEWYVERKDRCIDQIWSVACDIIETDSDVILELGLIQQSLRDQFYDKVESAGYKMKIYVVDASKEVRKARVQQRNEMRGETFSVEVPDQIFEMANSMWESIDESECRDFEVEFVSTES